MVGAVRLSAGVSGSYNEKEDGMMTNQDRIDCSYKDRGTPIADDDASQNPREYNPASRQEVQDQLTGKRPGVPGGPGSWKSDSEAERRTKAEIASQPRTGLPKA